MEGTPVENFGEVSFPVALGPSVGPLVGAVVSGPLARGEGGPSADGGLGGASASTGGYGGLGNIAIYLMAGIIDLYSV